jgi:hypothetical protein
MPESSARELVRFLRRRSGDTLRSAAYYDADSFELLYRDDTVTHAYSEDDIERIADRMRETIRQSRAERLFDLGGFDCSLLCFEDGVVFHFPQGRDRGTIISLDITAARQLHTFVEECSRQIYPEN